MQPISSIPDSGAIETNKSFFRGSICFAATPPKHSLKSCLGAAVHTCKVVYADSPSLFVLKRNHTVIPGLVREGKASNWREHHALPVVLVDIICINAIHASYWVLVTQATG